MMRLGIDASNLRAGGGISHLVELLRNAEPVTHGFSRVIVWGGRQTLDQIEERDWLDKRHDKLLERALPYRAFWQRFVLSRAAREARCDVLLVPGGTYDGSFRPVVTMSRNMLPFETREMLRYGWSPMTARLALLRLTQARSFRRADGVIFVSSYAAAAVCAALALDDRRLQVIPHGVDSRFSRLPKPQEPLAAYTQERPFRLVYVSIVDVYKHQWHVVRAVAALRQEGLPLALDLVGPAYPPALRRLNEALHDCDPAGAFIRYRGALPRERVHEAYLDADVCVFASSCENMPNILLEGMASGLPVACARRGPMPDVLGDTGLYFDPEEPQDIAATLRRLIGDPALRAALASASQRRASGYSWAACARDTFDFLQRVAAAPRPGVVRTQFS